MCKIMFKILKYEHYKLFMVRKFFAAAHASYQRLFAGIENSAQCVAITISIVIEFVWRAGQRPGGNFSALNRLLLL